MAMMLPSVISPDVKSSAERRIFEWFRDAPQTEDWIVLHSLGITAHKKVIYGETDFFVLAPHLGIFALEVKGGRVRRENGIWYFTDKYEHADSRSRGPFDQAKEGIFSIVSALKVRLDKQHEYLKNVFYGYGVMFPDIEYQAKGIDEEQWQVFDVRDGQNVRKFIEQLAQKSQDHWADTYGSFDSSKLPGHEDIKYLASILRGDFDYTISFSSQVRAVKEKQIRLTREQYRCLDQLDDNPRCLIQGPAGTGKTLIALEQVKKAAANGKKVALFCYNANLASWMESYFSKVSGALKPGYVGTLHAYMRSVLKRHEGQLKIVSTELFSAYYF